MTNSAHAGSADAQAKSILLVDDCAPVLAVVRAVLDKLGFIDVDEAGDGSAALLRLKDRRYDLVISDWSMEPMSGYDLLRAVRADPALRTTPFVMMTTKHQAKKLLRAKQAGVNECILKPFTPLSLQAKLATVFGLENPCRDVTRASFDTSEI